MSQFVAKCLLIAFKSMLVALMITSLDACDSPEKLNEQRALMQLDAARKSLSEGKHLAATHQLKSIDRNSSAWKEKGVPLENRIDEQVTQQIIEVLKTSDISSARMYLDQIDRNSEYWKMNQTSIENHFLAKAKEWLKIDGFHMAREYLDLIDKQSETWKKEGVIVSEKLAQRMRSYDAKKETKISKKQNLKGGLISYKWHISGFNTVAVIDRITIGNTSEIPCRDIRGIMSFYAKSETLLGEQPFIIYDIVPPNTKKTFRDITIGFIHSQVHGADIQILNCR